MEQLEPTPQTPYSSQSELQSLQQATAQNQSAQSPGLSAVRTQRTMNAPVVKQNLALGVIGGLVAAVVGAGAWAVITVVTEYQIGWMAIGIGCLVGLTVRGLGKGISPVFGLVGAGCALLGCVLGNLMSICGFASVNESIPFFEALGLVLSNPSLTMELMTATFSPIDVLFYGIAVYEGYKFSIRQTA